MGNIPLDCSRPIIDVFIDGIPYCQNKPRGNVEASGEWTKAVKEATVALPKIKTSCSADITFILPENKYPKDHPYGSDLDNLTKRLFDALNETVFSEVAGKDGSVIRLLVSKHKVKNDEPSGARVIISEIEVRGK